jgi:heptosyltransferase I
MARPTGSARPLPERGKVTPLARIVVVRFGAMGDILHTMPAVAALRRKSPGSEIAWVIEPKWIPLLTGSHLAAHVLPLNRRDPLSVWMAWRWLKSWSADIAYDFQGLWKSSLTAAAAAAQRIGFATPALRERGAGVFYTHTVAPLRRHVVDRNLELVGGGDPSFAFGPGFPNGELPAGPFVLAAPFAGWAAKQWPAERYAELASLLWQHRRLPLVLNVAPGQSIPAAEHLVRHESTLDGLIDATRRATAVLGLDSGPLHLAALLRKPGVALFGPTDPERNGPHGGTIKTLRAEGAITSYRRDSEISASMRALSTAQVWEALNEVLA